MRSNADIVGLQGNFVLWLMLGVLTFDASAIAGEILRYYVRPM